MGQALAKLESYYRNQEIKHRKQPKIHLNYIENNHTYNNNDYDFYVLVNKSDAIKEYLNRNIEKKVESMANQEKLLTIPEAAEYCGLRSDKTIRNWIKQGMPFVEVPGKTYPKKLVSILNLENWRSGKIETKTENMSFSNSEKHEPVDNSEPEILVTTSMSLPNNNFVTRDELNSYTLAVKDFTEAINDMKQENKLALELAISKQLDTFISMFEELKKEKDRELRESHAAIKNIIEDMERREGDIITRAITTWRQEKEKERLSKRSWWRRLFS